MVNKTDTGVQGQAIDLLSEDAVTDDVENHLLVECLLNSSRFMLSELVAVVRETFAFLGQGRQSP